MADVTRTIDGVTVTVPEGATIMEAADKAGIHIPRLCYHPELSIAGACRVCIVEVEGMRNLPASCSYPAAEGMVVRSHSPEVLRLRRDIVELLVDNHPMDCNTCERDGNCELQRLANAMGIRLRGIPAWWLARTYHLYLMPGIKRRWRLLVDWNVQLLFGRDAAELGSVGHARKLGDES